MAQNLKINILAKDKTKQALGTVQAGLTRLRGAIFSVQSAIIGIGGGLVVRSLLKTASDVEQLNVRFAFLFGNVKEGTKAFNTLIDFAGRVPFSLEEISTASGNLAVVAKDAEELNAVLKVTGNVAAVTGLDFRQTAEQIQRSFAGGIAAADVFRERGVRALLGFKAGATITAEETKKRFFEVFGPDGEFGKATEVLATTFSGTLSMLQDKLFKFKLDTNRAGFFDFVKNALVVVNKTIEKNSKAMAEFAAMVGDTLVKVIKQALLGGAALLDILRPIFQVVGLGIKGLIDIMKSLPPGVRELGIVGFLMLGIKGKILVATIGAILSKLGVDLDKITDKIFGAEDGTVMWGKATEKTQKFLKLVEENITISKQQMEELLGAIAKAEGEAEKVLFSFRKVAEVIGQKIRKDFESINTTIGNYILKGIQNFSRSLAEAVVYGKQLNASLKELAQKILVDILSFTIQLVIQRKIEAVLVDRGIIKERQKLNLIHQQSSALKKQAALKMMGGIGSMFGLPFFASGGAVSKGKPVVVGERGPELFVPNQTGQITQNARGAGGSPVNVNFTINAIDTQGFQEALVQNRGIISNIINQAVNERGAKNLI